VTCIVGLSAGRFLRFAVERPARRSRRARDAAVFASVHSGQRQPELYPERVPCVTSEPMEPATSDVVDESARFVLCSFAGV